jgi:hypothetical protein
MKSKKTHRSPSRYRREFNGSIEFTPPQPTHIEFIDEEKIYGFPIHQLTNFHLQEHSIHKDNNTLPPDELVLFYTSGMVVLKGWRLENLIGALASGRVARIHAEKHLGALMLGEAWVSEVLVFPEVRETAPRRCNCCCCKQP